MKRYIRLKERKMNISKIHTPSKEYRQKRPFLNYDSYFENTDEFGIIKTELSLESKNKILFLGDSFVESLYNSSDKRLASLFEKKINRLGYDYEVINGGVSGATTLNLFNTLINKFIPWNINILYFFVSTNDGVCIGLAENYWNAQKNYSNLVNSTDNQIFFNKKNETFKLEEIKNIYKLLFKTCELFNIQLCICISPMITDISNFYFDNQLKNEKLSVDREKVFNLISELCGEEKINCLDFRKEFSNKKELFFDDVHINDLGSESISEYMIKNLKILDHSQVALNKKCIFQNKKNNKSYLLTREIVWIDELILDQNFEYECVLSLHLACEKVVRNNALFCIDFDGKAYKFEETGLFDSRHIGSFKYLITESHSRYNLQNKFTIPKGVKKIRFGLALWHDLASKIEVSSINIYFRKKLVDQNDI